MDDYQIDQSLRAAHRRESLGGAVELGGCIWFDLLAFDRSGGV